MPVMQEKYLPFSEENLLRHFAPVKMDGGCISNKKRLNYYKKSIGKYIDFPKTAKIRKGKPLKELKGPCQIEKDERFWTASALMTIYYSKARKNEFVELLKKAYGDKPPFEDCKSWNDCIDGELFLFFEANLPSPESYKNWLREHLMERHFIPYILDSAINDRGEIKTNLEGPTNVDAILINKNNGFAVIVEAKVLSDISYDITYDAMRNQIARTIDVMLEKNDKLCFPLNKRDPEKTLFLLLTPKIFKDNPESRLYGYKFNDYKSNADYIKKDLPHRNIDNFEKLQCRLGWLTWEDIREINGNCCLWLE